MITHDATRLPRPCGWLVIVLAMLVGPLVPAGGGRTSAAPPTLIQEAKLTPGGAIDSGFFGGSVALSADGQAALVGDASGNELVGAVDVFARSGAAWTQETRLTPSGALGQARFGGSVALSADGQTAVIGAPFDDLFFGAVYLFGRSGAAWTQQAKLTGSAEFRHGGFGWFVAVSGDGRTALVGASDGEAIVYNRSGTTWTQQAILTPARANGNLFTALVALSGDGQTALVGTPIDIDNDNHSVGAVYIFGRSGTTWIQQTRLTRVGGSVALSGDGRTALIGDFSGSAGAVDVFGRSGATWTQEAKLTGSGAFGESVALSADSQTALVSAPDDNSNIGAVFAFARSGTAWTQEGKLTGNGEIGRGSFGVSVAVSAEGRTALIGAPFERNRGAAYAFGAAPLVGVAVTCAGSASPTLKVGQRVPCHATGTYADTGTQNLTALAVWAASDGSIAAVDGAGTVTARTPGTVMIAATFDSVTGQAMVTVSPPTLTGVQPAPAPAGRPGAAPAPGGVPTPAPLPPGR